MSLFLIFLIVIGILFFLYRQDKVFQKNEKILKNVFNTTTSKKSVDLNNESITKQNECPNSENQQENKKDEKTFENKENKKIKFKKLKEIDKNHFQITNEKEIKFFKKYSIPILIMFLIFIYYPMKIDVPMLICDVEVCATYSIINQEITISMGSLKFKEKCNLFKYIEVKTKYIFCDKQELRENIIDIQKSMVQNMFDNFEKQFDNMNF